MTRPHRFPSRIALFVAALSLVACDAILGFEDAELDPLLVGGGGAGGAAPDDLCAEYCATITANCTDANTQYSSEANCNQVCPNLPGFNDPSTIGNTVGCRLENANQAATIGPNDECPTAGPGAEGQCGENCETFCRLFEKACGAETVDQFPYADQGACRTDCETFPDVGGFSADANDGTTDGNSVQCRLYHVSQAFIDAAFHCQHAAGQDVCIDAGTGGAGGS